MHRFVSRLQVLAGQFRDTPANELLNYTEALAQDIPEGSSRVEQLAIANLLGETLRRLIRAIGAPAQDRLNLNRHTFQQHLKQLRKAYTTKRRDQAVECLELIRRQHDDPALSVAIVASQMRLSRWHLTRTLTRSTGHGFQWHLHAERTRRAAELLAESRLSVKEISASVGYMRANQLDRHFREQHGVTPSQYRRIALLD